MRTRKRDVRVAIDAFFRKTISYQEFIKRIGSLYPSDPLERSIFEATFLHAFEPATAAEKLRETRRNALKARRLDVAEQALFELQLLYGRMNNHAEAVRLCRELVREHPSGSALLFLAVEEEAVGNRAEALSIYRRLVRRKGMKTVAAKAISRLTSPRPPRRRRS